MSVAVYRLRYRRRYRRQCTVDTRRRCTSDAALNGDGSGAGGALLVVKSGRDGKVGDVGGGVPPTVPPTVQPTMCTAGAALDGCAHLLLHIAHA
ncbi:hypothetical protein FGB62_2g017 [Gracilaria domingensis]|nr:hypothetical protein FGB62_2g017 [Gracilaria domingensis]